MGLYPCYYRETGGATVDIILQDENGVDVMIIDPVSFDLALGVGEHSENDFELSVPDKAPIIKSGMRVYIEGTAYGGIITRLKVNSGYTWCGQTWSGILSNKVVLGQSDGENLVLSEEIHSTLRKLIAKYDLQSLFEVESGACNLTPKRYEVPLYATLYDAIHGFISASGGKLLIRYNGAKAVLSVIPLKNWAEDEEFDTNLVNLTADMEYLPVNHLVCRGTGQKDERIALELYLDAKGNVSERQTFFGLQEHAEYYNYTSADKDTLIKDGTKRLKDYWKEATKLSVELTDQADRYDIGDIVGAVDDRTGLTVSAPITKKVITIDKNGVPKVTYTTGDKQ